MIVADSKVILAPSGRPAFLEALENNWYEGSRWSPNRSFIWHPVQPARKDLDKFTRYELNKNARYLYKNSPFIRGAIERMVTLTVGCGFTPTFVSQKVPLYGKKVKAWWKKRSRNIHLGPRASFSQYVRCLGRARFLDGEGFSIKTFDELSMENRVQGVEADRCTGEGWKKQADNHEDGILLNRQNTPTAYKFKDIDKPYDAADVIHHFTPNRLSQFRGETVLAAAINTARDVDDILALEKQCVKDASSKMDIIQTATGELDPETNRLSRYGSALPFNLPTDNRTKDDYYRPMFGAKPVVLKAGDEYTPYKPDRPGAAWQGFMDFLANTICLSSAFPPSVILPLSIGGTDIRRDLDIAQRVVEPIQYDIVAELDEIVQYFLAPEIYDGELQDAPDDLEVLWHFPQQVNVDRQTAQADREDVQAGLMSRAEYHGRYSQDGDAYEQTVIDEAKKRLERIKAAGFKTVKDFVEVLALDPSMFMGGDAPDPSGDTAPKLKKKKKKVSTA